MNIVCCELEEWQRNIVQEKYGDHHITFIDGPLNKENAHEAKDAEILAVFVFSQIDREVIDMLPNLKLIATMSTGFDHIDVSYTKEKNITIATVPTYGENTVAEHTFALILALSRKIYPSVKRTREEDRFVPDISLRGFDLKGKTLGLIGCGNIGKHVARMGVGFGMTVKVFDLHHDQQTAEEIGFTYAHDLNEVFATSDVMSMHVPYNEHTHHLVSEQAFAQMKPNALIINTARGGIIDTHALINALKDGKIAGAGLDVLEGEKEIKDELSVLTHDIEENRMRQMLEGHILMNMAQVIVTPHNAFNSQEALTRILDTTILNIKEFIENGSCTNSVQ